MAHAASLGRPDVTDPAATLLRPQDIAMTRGLPDWLAAEGISLALTAYEANRLIFVGVDEAARLALHEVEAERAMALHADPDRLILAGRHTLTVFDNLLRPGETANGADRLFVPRVAYTTGDLDIHDVALTATGEVVFVNTLYSCLAAPSLTHSFRPLWRPPFISRLAAEDRCHLNGLAMRDGAPAFVTATSRSDVVGGWRARRAEGGVVVDVASGEIVTDRLSMPHSPRWRSGELWVLNSGTGEAGVVDLAAGGFEPRAFCPGFLRGLAFHGDHALVGLSKPRDGAFAGLALDAALQARDADPWCGVQVIDLRTGDVVHWLRFFGPLAELFDVRVLEGVRRPVAASPSHEAVDRHITLEPD